MDQQSSLARLPDRQPWGCICGSSSGSMQPGGCMNTSVTDRVEQSIEVKAPRSRVWRALVDSHEFAAWFGIAVDGPFAPGARLRGTLVGTTADAEVAKAQKAHEGVTFDMVVAQIEPERRFSFRW